MTDTTSQLDATAIDLDSPVATTWSATTWFAVISMAATSFALVSAESPSFSSAVTKRSYPFGIT